MLGADGCWSCGGGLPDGAAFCPACGHSQEDRESSPLFIVDASTGLFNAVFLRAVVEQETNRGMRYRRPLAAVGVEIDHGEIIGQDLGPDVEVILRALAGILNEVVRDTDTVGVVARAPSPRFGIVLPETDVEGALQTCDKIRAAVAAHEFEGAGRWQRLTVSCGAAALNFDRLGGRDLLSQAGEAVEEGRAAGPNRTHVAVRTLI